MLTTLTETSTITTTMCARKGAEFAGFPTHRGLKHCSTDCRSDGQFSAESFTIMAAARRGHRAPPAPCALHPPPPPALSPYKDDGLSTILLIQRLKVKQLRRVSKYYSLYTHTHVVINPSMGVTERLVHTCLEQCSQASLAMFLVVLSVIYMVKQTRYLSTLPPGPWGLPILGSLSKIKKPFHLQMHEFALTYGRLMSVKMGSQLVVVINEAKTLKQVLCRAEFTARPKSALDSIVQGFGKQTFLFLFV